MSLSRFQDSWKSGNLRPIEIGPEQLLCDAACSLNRKNMLARKGSATVEPTPYGRLGDTQQTRRRRLRTDPRNGFFQRFERGWGRLHNPDLKDKL